MKEEAKDRICELAKQLMELKSKERLMLNELDDTRRRILETEMEMHHILQLSEPRRN